jgi:putative intracellular protease/amidase
VTQKGQSPNRQRIWMPLPDNDFDTTEVAVPWKVLREAGHEVVFATERGGAAPACDPKLIDGVIFGRLGAKPKAIEAYRELEGAPEFNAPVPWKEIEPERFDGLVLAGGHAPGMKQYLGSDELQAKVREFWALERPVGAICHGVLVLARAGVLGSTRTTCLTKSMEKGAYLLTSWRLGRYYRTYPAYVQDEVVAALNDPKQFDAGPMATYSRPWVVEDGRYVSGRWPGDASLFAERFEALLSAGPRPQPAAGTPQQAT